MPRSTRRLRDNRILGCVGGPRAHFARNTEKSLVYSQPFASNHVPLPLANSIPLPLFPPVNDPPIYFSVEAVHSSRRVKPVTNHSENVNPRESKSRREGKGRKKKGWKNKEKTRRHASFLMDLNRAKKDHHNFPVAV